MTNFIDEDKKAVEEFLQGGGEMGERIRNLDWSATPLGPIRTWPASLRTCIRIMLTSSQPIWIGWGPQLVKFYNDPYKKIAGGKHPQALGQPASIVWKDIWKDIDPMLTQVMQENRGTYVEEQLLIMERYGYPEETYYTFSYTPVPGDDGGTAGMICFNTDDTQRIISERQLKTYTEMGQALSGAHSEKEIFEKAISVFGGNSKDFPFAIFYKAVENSFVRSATTYIEGTSLAMVDDADAVISPYLDKALHIREPLVAEALMNQFQNLPTGAWEIPPTRTLVLPVTADSALVIGLNPYLLLDDEYLRFFMLLVDQMAKTISNVQYLEAERNRAAALAELDRAKTIFFSNISHEFRTPLTLLLGPITEALNHPDIPTQEKDNLRVAHRNALRMQKLTNTLLDFSRIEAGRLHGSFQKTNIVLLTRELASTFRAAVEKSGMTLTVDAGIITSDVYVDVNMWEKIVLNLISNAFKYTPKGSIDILVREINGMIELSVTDTGIGIPENELERIFERFHRVEGSHARSQEGTGIGLSMVKELVKLHGGSIQVESQPGRGSTFTVSVPAGKSHLPHDRIQHENTEQQISENNPFVREVYEWTNNTDEHEEGEYSAYKILLADDNSDMRQYVKRILSSKFAVRMATNGEEAFAMAMQSPPDLIISDIMMPVLDGYGLLTRIRKNEELRSTPVIFLSARAGDEAKVEGLEAGAEDYLTKPFSAKELVARVETNIRLSINRRTAEKSEKYFRRLADSVPATLWRTDRNNLCTYINKRWLEFTGQTREQAMGTGWLEMTHPDDKQRAGQIFIDAASMKQSFSLIYRLRHISGEYRWCMDSGSPTYDAEGNFEGYVGSVIDVHEETVVKDALRNSLQELQLSEERFRILATTIPQIVWTTNRDGNIDYLSDQWKRYTGSDATAGWHSFIHPAQADKALSSWQHSFATGQDWSMEYLLKAKTGQYRWFTGHAQALKDSDGNIVKWIGAATDIHDLKEQASVLEQKVHDRTIELNASAQALQQTNEDLQQFAHVASHDLREPVRKIKTFVGRLEDEESNAMSDKAKNYIGKIQRATDRMSAMIEGVLHYSMTNTLEGDVEQIDMNELITDVCGDFELLIAKKNASIIHSEMPVIEGARVLIYQLIYNLVNNSLKFSRENVAPLIEFSSSIIDEDNRGFAIIRMRDNGIGFDQGSAVRIFQTFERLHPKDKYEGTGLGLSLCKKIVQRHKGKIFAEGSPGEGAVFTVQLPLKQ